MMALADNRIMVYARFAKLVFRCLLAWNHIAMDCVAEMKETFAMFEADGAITTHQLGLALRAMGQNPSEGEIQTLAASAELSGMDCICFHF